MSMADRPARLLIVINRPDVVTAVVRGLQYRALFEASAQWQVEYMTRIPRWLVRVTQAWPQRRAVRWMAGALERAVLRVSDRRICRAARSADVVYAITMSSATLQETLVGQGVTYVMDVIDGLWLPWFRQFGWQDFESMVSSADGIICENAYTADHVRRYHPHVEVVPDSPQLGAFDRLRGKIRRDDPRIVIGWIGGKDSADALYVVYEALERLFAEFPQLHLRILGAAPEYLPRFEHVRYSLLQRYDQSVMVREALGLDIGIYPQFQVQESLHRGTLKAKIYMSAGVATVCQRLGENTRLIRDGENGLLASSGDEWYEKLRWLVEHPDQRARLGAGALETMRQQFTVERCFGRLEEALRTIHQLKLRERE